MVDREGTIRHLVEDIRRRLVVHAAVRGHEVDLPSLLVYISITKDIDRLHVSLGTCGIWPLPVSIYRSTKVHG